MATMAEDLAGEIKAAAGDLTAASNIFREALQRFPLSRALAYGYADTLFSQRSYDRLQVFLDEQLQLYPSDPKLYGLLAKTHAVQGRNWGLVQSRALSK